MPNGLALSGGQPQKPTRFAPIYTGRFFSGIWTNRSPLRDAGTNRLTEKFYGAAGDAMIDGLNVEITNRLTLARRPGNPVYDSHSYSAVDRFEAFRMFGPNSEQINVMIDEANNLYSLYNGTRTLVFSKSTGAGQTFMQSVGNSLYFGNGVDNKKWLQSLQTWTSNESWNGATSPFMNTFLVDPNGNIQQLVSTVLTITATQVASNVLTVTANTTLTNILTIGLKVKFPAVMTSTFLEGKTVSILSVSGSTFTAAFVHADYGPTAESNILATVVEGGTPISGSVQPTWSTTPLTPGMANPALAQTVDGTALWINRGGTVENWGIQPPTTNLTSPLTFTIGSSRSAWRANTFFSYPGVIIDSNGNLQQVFAEGTSGATTPTWATVVGNTTSDGTVTWKMIQTAASLIWTAHTNYTTGQYIVGNATGTNCLFQLQQANVQPYISGALSLGGYANSSDSFNITFPAPAPSFTLTPPSLYWIDDNATTGTSNVAFAITNGAGEITGWQNSGHKSFWQAWVTGTIHITVPGQYSFSIDHDDGCIWAIGSGAQKISGVFSDPNGHTVTAKLGLNQLCGTNIKATDTSVWNFPTAGDYVFEIDYANNANIGYMKFLVNGQQLTTGPNESGGTQPVWPNWSTSFAPNYPSVTEAAGQYKWINLGPAADYVWTANVNYTLPNTTIIDKNGNTEAPYRTGITGTAAPTWATGTNQLTIDNPNLIWINQGPAASPPVGTISTFNGGWQYGIALVNSLDDTVSNCGTLTAQTGDFVGAEGVTISGGLPPVSEIDPQVDYVAIFRTTDGLAVPFLIPGTDNAIYTVRLSDYLANGYVDTTPDTGLNNLLTAPISGENTPPAAGAVNLTYHLNRIWYSIGNVVYWTTGPLAPIGNGVNGTSPLNFDAFPSLVKRIVPCALGALVFTVSDIFLITGQGTTSNPIQGGQPFLQKIGLLSYNALDVNGSIMGLFTTDNQFIILDPTSGVSYAGFPIGDRLRQSNGNAGTNWNPADVYVTWHVNGEDAAWYLSDGKFGWYRLMATPAPETGYTWSPFAAIQGGCKAVQSIETAPGVHNLLLGPLTTGPILKRDLDVFTDNGATYPCQATIGSIVLANPGQVAQVGFIATDSVRVGTPLDIGVIMDEAVPYYTGPFEFLSVFTNDPPTLPKSSSINGQRFYFDELERQAAVCRHMQIQIRWLPENVRNELLTMTIFGAYYQEN